MENRPKNKHLKTVFANLLVFIPKHSIFWRRLKNLVVLFTQPFCDEKKMFLELFFPAKFLQLDIFRTTNAKRIKFMNDFWRWWLISFQSDSFCKRLNFTKSFTLKTCLIKESRANRQIFSCAAFSWMLYSSSTHGSLNTNFSSYKNFTRTFFEVLGLWLFLLLRIVVQKYV
jgi:hypothetical protein